jgi:hypothetical protein
VSGLGGSSLEARFLMERTLDFEFASHDLFQTFGRNVRWPLPDNWKHSSLFTFCTEIVRLPDKLDRFAKLQIPLASLANDPAYLLCINRICQNFMIPVDLFPAASSQLTSVGLFCNEIQVGAGVAR